MSQKARREGLLALEPMLEEITDPFPQKAAYPMIIDGLDPDLVVDVLGLDIQLMEERHRDRRPDLQPGGDVRSNPWRSRRGNRSDRRPGEFERHRKTGPLDCRRFCGHPAGYLHRLCGVWHPFANKLKMLSKR